MGDHARGPWRIGKPVLGDPQATRVDTIHGPPGLVAFVEIRDGSQADLRLIAAAPTLLDGLDEALRLMYDADPSACDDSSDYRRLRALADGLGAPGDGRR